MTPALMKIATTKKMAMLMTLILMHCQHVSHVVKEVNNQRNSQRQPELNLSIRQNSSHAESEKDEPEDQYPRPLRDYIRPVPDHKGDCVVLVRKHRDP